MHDPVAGWHAYMRTPSTAALDALLAEDVVFQSPAVHTPQPGKAVTMKYLSAAAEVLGRDDFTYVGEWRAERSAVLEFTCTLADGIKVNAADPGYTATDFNGHAGYRTVEQAAAGIAWLASQDAFGPTGGFYFEQETVPW